MRSRSMLIAALAMAPGVCAFAQDAPPAEDVAPVLDPTELAEYGPAPSEGQDAQATAEDDASDDASSTSADEGDFNSDAANDAVEHAHSEGHGHQHRSGHAHGGLFTALLANHVYGIAAATERANGVFGQSPSGYGAIAVAGSAGAKQFYYIRQDHYARLSPQMNRPDLLLKYTAFGPNPVGGRYNARKDYIYYWYPLCSDRVDKAKYATSKPNDRKVTVSCQ